MKLILELNEVENVIYNDDNSVFISTPNLNKINILLKNKKYIEQEIEYLSEFEDFKDLEIQNLEKYLKKPLTLKDFNEINIVVFSIKELLKYKKLLEKLDGEITICLQNKEIPFEEIKELENINFKNKIFIKSIYNEMNEQVLLKEFIESIEIIDKIKSQITKYNLSKLEQLMLLYDILKDRVYKDDKKHPENSRDLTSVLKSDYIVCLGFANIFSCVANNLGIVTEKKNYFKEDTGHAVNVCYINDSKYNFKGCLEFDVTWDAKKRKNSNNVNNYNWYGNSIIFSQELKKQISHFPLNQNNSIRDESLIETIIRYYKTYSNFPNNMFLSSLLKKLNKFYLYLEDNDKIYLIKTYVDKIKNNEEVSKEEIDILMNDIINFQKKSLPKSVFGKVFYNVRRIEHMINPKKYPLSYQDIISVIDNNYKQRQDERLEELILGKKLYKEQVIKRIIKSSYTDTINETTYLKKLKNDALRMELLHNLKKRLKEQMEEQQKIKR